MASLSLKKILTEILKKLVDLQALQATCFYQVGDTVTLSQSTSDSDNFRVTCSGCLTNSKNDIWFLIPLDKPVSSNVTQVTLAGNLRVRCAGSYSIGSAGGSTSITNYTHVLNLSPCGIIVKVSGSSFAGTNNHPVEVDLFNMTATFS